MFVYFYDLIVSKLLEIFVDLYVIQRKKEKEFVKYQILATVTQQLVWKGQLIVNLVYLNWIQNAVLKIFV